MTAGHTWGLDGRCTCGKRLTDISFAAYGPEWIGKPNIAHSGDLTSNEQDQLRAEVEAMFDHVRNAASGGSAVSAPPMHDDSHIEF